MGSAESVMKQTSDIVQQAEVNQTATCKCQSDNTVGPITQELGPCCVAQTINIKQNASANCSCDMKSAIEQLADMSATMTQSAKSALSGAMSKNNADLNTSVKVRQALTQACEVDSDASNTVKGIDIKMQSCCGMSDAQVEAAKQAMIAIDQSASVQGQCLSSIAAKTASTMTTQTTQTATTTNFLSDMVDSVMGAVKSLFNMGPMLAVAAVGMIVVVMILKGMAGGGGMGGDDDNGIGSIDMSGLAAAHGGMSHDDGGMGDDMHEMRAEVALLSKHFVVKPRGLTARRKIR